MRSLVFAAHGVTFLFLRVIMAPKAKSSGASAGSGGSRRTPSEATEAEEELYEPRQVVKKHPKFYLCPQVQESLFRFTKERCANASCQKCAYRLDMLQREENAQAAKEKEDAEAGIEGKRAQALSLWSLAAEFRRRDDAQALADMHEGSPMESAEEAGRIQNLGRLKEFLGMGADDVISDYQIQQMTDKFVKIATEPGRDWQRKKKIYPAEFQSVVFAAGIATLTRKRMLKTFRAFDTNHDGYIDLEEWEKVVTTRPSDYQMRKTFRTFDSSGNGWLDAGEIKDVFGTMFGIHLDQLDIKVLMDNQDRLNYKGFADMIAENLRCNGDKPPFLMQKAFESFDEDKNGTIDPDELLSGLTRIGLEGLERSKCVEIISRIDEDGDGVMDIDEFMEAITSGKLQDVFGELEDAPPDDL